MIGNITGAFAAGVAGNPKGVMDADPFLIAHSLYNPALQFIPGTDDGELHNLNTIDGGKGSADPRTMNNRHNAPPGVRLDDSNVDRSRTPNEGWNQSSNLPAAKPITQSGSNIPGAPGNPIGIANQITNDQRMQFAMINPGSISPLGGRGFLGLGKYLT